MHQTARGAVLVTTFFAIAVTGCRDEIPNLTEPSRHAEMTPDRALTPGPTRPDEARLAHFASVIPGFGGLSYGPDGELVVYLSDLRQSKAAEAALAQLARNPHSRGPKSGQIVIRQGRYDFFQLQSWRDHLSDPLLDIPGVTFLDLDEGENRLTVGLANPAAQSLAEEKLRELGVPLEAAAFVPMGYPDVSAPVASGSYVLVTPAQSSSLQEYRRPLIGGLQLGFHTSDLDANHYYQCTLSFVALRAGDAVGVTNSHCSEKSWDLDNTSYFQEQPGGGRYIGFEYADPNGQSCGFLSINVCRNADVMAIYLEDGVTSQVGYIARTLYAGDNGGSGSTTLDASNPTFAISSIGSPVQNGIIAKVGRSTGWTKGDIARTCVDLEVGYRSYSKLRCQNYATNGRLDGDSGAPVFHDNENGTVMLLGVHWGENDTYAIFSSMESIQKDLGTLDVYAPGYGPGGDSGSGSGGGSGECGGLQCTS